MFTSAGCIRNCSGMIFLCDEYKSCLRHQALFFVTINLHPPNKKTYNGQFARSTKKKKLFMGMDCHHPVNNCGMRILLHQLL